MLFTYNILLGRLLLWSVVEGFNCCKTCCCEDAGEGIQKLLGGSARRVCLSLDLQPCDHLGTSFKRIYERQRDTAVFERFLSCDVRMVMMLLVSSRRRRGMSMMVVAVEGVLATLGPISHPLHFQI